MPRNNFFYPSKKAAKGINEKNLYGWHNFLGCDWGTNPEAMNVLEVRNRWNEVKNRLQQKYTTLTDEDLFFRFGREEEIISRLQKKLGKSKADVMKLIGET